MASGRVSIAIDQGVAHVRLTRAASMNALDNPMFDALVAAGQELAEVAGLRCVVLSGEGRAFCAGIDKDMVGRLAGGDTTVPGVARGLVPRTHGRANREQHAVLLWRDLPVPVIAAVHGFAFGGGLQLMLGADMRYIDPAAQLSIMEIKWGLVPDMGGTLLMRTLVREDVARELTYTGRIFSGMEAAAVGFATRACEDPVRVALDTARQIAGNSPTAVRAAKRLFNESHTRDAPAALLAESREQEELMRHPHHTEAVAANLQRRAPVFED
jgi:enoyl-CoA hydratase/carnithine racemase